MSAPLNLGHKVSSRDQSWLQLVQRSWGSEFTAPDHGIYVFSNGRKWDSSDKGRSGIYGVEVMLKLEVDSLASEHYPDMDHSLTISNEGQDPIHTDIISDSD